MPTVRTNGVETYYERRGSGPPVVFVHAAIMDHTMWTPQMDALDDAYTVIAYDVRGHGRTGGSDVKPYTIELYAEDLDAFLTALDLDRPVLCGLSTGGAIAQTYAARHPDRISGVVLADTFVPGITHWRDAFTFALLTAAILPVRLFGIARIQRVMRWVHERFNEGSGGEYGTIERLQAEMPPIPSDEFAKIVRSITSFRRVSLDLRSITVPALVVHGENTPGVVRRHSRKLAAEIPDVTVREVPGGGHACNLDNPEFFTNEVREFLARVTAPDATGASGGRVSGATATDGGD